MRLAYGAIQRSGTLDHVIERLAGRPPHGLTLPFWRPCGSACMSCSTSTVRPTTRSSLTAVELAKTRPRLGSQARQCRAAPGDARGSRRADRRPARGHARAGRDRALPSKWLARLWWEELGPEDARALMAADNEPGELALRVNTLRADPSRRGRDGRGHAYRPLAVRGARARWSARRCTAPLWRRARSSPNLARRCSSHGRSILSQASACSTCVRPPAARALIRGADGDRAKS